MTYPTDSAGNPKVDFVWGNMPMQPDDQRDTITSGSEVLMPPNADGNRGWDASLIYPSEGITTSVTARLSLGDQSYDADWQDPDFRYVQIPADSHTIITTGYSNYPGYIPNYSGDGDTGLEAVVPSVVGLTTSQAQAVIQGAGFGYIIDNSIVTGATVTNDGRAVYSVPAAGSKPDAGSNVTVFFYNAPEVPDVINSNQVDATTIITDASLVVGTVTDTFVGSTVENDGLVKSVSPAVGTTLNTGSSVNLVLFNAPEVPDLIGTNIADAYNSLLAIGLAVGTNSSTYTGATVVNNGLINSQSIVAGTTVDENTAIDLIWYEAPIVPDLTGYSETGVNDVLTAYSLVKGTVTTDYVGATVANDGTVKSQSIASGTMVDEGTTVDVVLYAAPTVPDVLGLTEAAAETSLNTANLVKGTVTTTGDGATAENDGTVKSQTPTSGGKANTGSSVDLELYLFAP